MAKSKSTKTKKKSSTPNAGYKKFLLGAKQNWFLSLLVFLLCVTVLLVVVAQYKDWKNEKDMRALASVFETLPSELEQALGVPFVVEKGCSQTQEKFNEGVFICDITIYHDDALPQTSPKKIQTVLEATGATSTEPFKNSNLSYRFSLHGADCAVDFERKSFNDNGDFVVISCTPEIRKPNRQLANELFSEQ